MRIELQATVDIILRIEGADEMTKVTILQQKPEPEKAAPKGGSDS